MNNQDTAKELIENALKKAPLIPKPHISSDILTLYNIVNAITGDRKVFFSPSHKQATKMFLDSCNNSADTAPEDFILTQVATWNKHTGEVLPIEKVKQTLMKGHYVKPIGDDLKTLIKQLVKKEMEIINNGK